MMKSTYQQKGFGGHSGHQGPGSGLVSLPMNNKISLALKKQKRVLDFFFFFALI